MSKITKDGLTQSGLVVPIWQQWASKGEFACANLAAETPVIHIKETGLSSEA